jgi:alpha-tubulin suppressor-like RCC1 family protein
MTSDFKTTPTHALCIWTCGALVLMNVCCASSVSGNHRFRDQNDTGLAMACTNANVPNAAESSAATQVVSGVDHWCAIMSDHVVRCMGDNTLGQLGVGDWEYRPRPTPIIELTHAVQVGFSGNNTTCARTSLGEVWCWGANIAGELGNAHLEDQICGGMVGGRRRCNPRPARINGIPPAEQLVLGGRFICAVANDRGVWCWGTTVESGRPVEYASPVQIGVLDEGVQFALVRDIPIMVRMDGAIVTRAVDAPTSISSRARLRANFFGTICAIVADGRVQCMGRNADGMVGVGNETAAQITTMQDVGLDCVVDLVMGAYHVCALHSDGHVSCWGSNRNGETGQDTRTSMSCGGAPCTSTPVRVQGIENVVSVLVGGFTTCAVRSDASTWCWGAGPGRWSPIPRRIDW